MECKWDYKNKLKPGDICELIDTLWNVNELKAILVRLATAELIDTLWNVNAERV